MDLKGKSWVGSIYHKFEAICQEVDDFVSKDTMHYIENQAQSIGVSVKRIYSDVVQDVIPPLGDDIKPETKSVTGKEADIEDHVTSISSNMTKLNVDEKQLPVEQEFSDTLKQCDTSQQSDIGLVIHSTKTGVSLKKDGNNIIWNESLNPSCKSKILSVTSEQDDQENYNECNTKMAMVSSPSDEADYFSNEPSNGWLSEGELPLVLDFSLDENESLPEPPQTSSDKGHQHLSPTINSPTLLACDAAQRPKQTYGTLCNSFSTKDEQTMASNDVQSSELVISYCSCDNEKGERSVISSSQYTPSKSLNLLDSASANYTRMAENICNTPVGSNGNTRHTSVVHACSPSATVSNEIKSVDMLPPFSIIKSNDCNASATHGSASVVSSASRHPQCYKGSQSTLLMSSSESGNSILDIGDLNMETIDLSADKKCDVLTTNYGATHYRHKNFRYYKKLLKDAFASRKRLSKEYEHLAILHGDIDMEAKHNFQPNSLPPSSTTSLPSHNICDSDWEVL